MKHGSSLIFYFLVKDTLFVLGFGYDVCYDIKELTFIFLKLPGLNFINHGYLWSR